MIERYFSAPKTLRRLRAGPSGSHVDGFAKALAQQGYALASAVRYVRAAAHLGGFVQRQGGGLSAIDASTLEAFGRHLVRCRCPPWKAAKIGHHARFGVKVFHRYLVEHGICPQPPLTGSPSEEPALVSTFRDWFRTHRGVTHPTLRLYARGATELLHALGDDPSQWTAQAVRSFLLDRARQCGAGTTQKLITSLRAFLRYLSFCGVTSTDLALAIPAIAHWRLATLPRCLSTNEVERLIATCDGRTPLRRRERAIVLLLVRLGLRAGDVAQLRFTDIDWTNGTVQVMGKGRYQVRLPLPQDVGDALLRYVECRPRLDPTDRVFVRGIAPSNSVLSGDAISSVVKRALRRAGIAVPAPGAHLLRHTAATEMLRHGVPLDQIGLVLRHRSIDMSAYYAKVDVALLQQIAQPWPGVPS